MTRSQIGTKYAKEIAAFKTLLDGYSYQQQKRDGDGKLMVINDVPQMETIRVPGLNQNDAMAAHLALTLYVIQNELTDEPPAAPAPAPITPAAPVSAPVAPAPPVTVPPPVIPNVLQ